MLQHIPLEVTDAFPSEVTIPPPVAEVAVILVTEEVDNVGNSSFLQECNIGIRPKKSKTMTDIFKKIFIGLKFIFFVLKKYVSIRFIRRIEKVIN